MVKDEPRQLFYEGRCLEDAMRSERVTEEEIESAMRQQGFANLDAVGAAVLETDGSVTIIPDTDPGSTLTLSSVSGRPDKGAQDALQ